MTNADTSSSDFTDSRICPLLISQSSQRSADAFYESLEKIINELKSTASRSSRPPLLSLTFSRSLPRFSDQYPNEMLQIIISVRQDPLSAITADRQLSNIRWTCRP